jgi:hypothetical protein
MDAKFQFRANGVELVWEGAADFLKKEIPSIVKSLADALNGIKEAEDSPNPGRTSGGTSVKMTTAAIAGKLQSSTGPELFKAALIYFHLVKGQETASRAEILHEMKTVKNRYKPSYSGNLSQTVTALIAAQEINEPSTGSFALVPDEMTKAEKALK